MSRWSALLGWYVVASVCLAISYGVIIRPSIDQFLQGGTSIFWSSLLEWTYPRWIVERHRFPSSFFLHFADQVVLRLWIWASFFTLTFFAIIHRYPLRRKWIAFFSGSMNSAAFNGYNAMFYLLVAYISTDLLPELIRLSEWTALYQPISFLGVLGIPFPYTSLLWLYGVSLIVLCCSLAFGLHHVLASVYVAVLFIVLEGLYFSFGKLDHQYASLHYALMIWPYMMQFRSSKTEYPRWPVALIRLAIVLGYGFSGLEKLMLHGVNWPLDAFCPYVQQWVPYGQWNNGLCILLGGFILLFQLSFVLVMWFPKLKYVYLPTGILFHVTVYLTTGIGGILHPWWLMYMFFVNWEWIGFRLSAFQLWVGRLHKRP